MMKWGRKKPSLPSPSHSSSSSSIFPSSWFSKIKRTKKNEPSKGEKETPTSWKSGRFYCGGDNSDWKLSFEENYEVEKSNLNSVWYDSENENQEFGFPSCRSCRTDEVAKREESLKFSQMVSNIRKLRESPVNEGAKKNHENVEIKRNSREERKSKKKNREDYGEKKVDFEKEVDKVDEANLILQEKDIFELKPMKLTRASKKGNHGKEAYLSNCDFKTIEEAYMLEALKLDQKRVNSEWGKSKERKYEEFMEKSENQRKSVYITTEEKRKAKKNSSKIRAYTPRTAYKIECKIKAIENMKRAKKKEKRMSEKPAEIKTVFDSFAVVKNSCDPQSDFKNSMIEMITAKKITKTEELEELLACYLTLNADIYHDTIIKVFRQVWFELIRDHLTSAIEN